jgi:hypothetical protein
MKDGFLVHHPHRRKGIVREVLMLLGLHRVIRVRTGIRMRAMRRSFLPVVIAFGAVNLWIQATPAVAQAAAVPEPVPGDVNSSGDESDLTTTLDGLEGYVSTDGRAGGEGSWDIWRVTRSIPSEPWGNLENVSELNTSNRDASPCISPDGLRIYFHTDYIDGASGSSSIVMAEQESRQKELLPASEWIVMAERESRQEEFGPAQVLPVLHAAGALDNHPKVTFDELEIVFGSTRDTVPPNDYDLFIARRDSIDSDFGSPEPIAAINTDGREGAACFSPDGLMLIFDRDGDLYYTMRRSRQDEFVWSCLLPLVNTPEVENKPWISYDKSTLYWHSYPSGYGDVWHIPLAVLRLVVSGVPNAHWHTFR